MKSISKDQFDKYKEAQANLALYSSDIEERLDYILHKINEVCGGSFDWWNIDGANNSEIGDISKTIDGNYIDRCYIYIHGTKGNNDPQYNIILNNEEWDLSEMIPLEWLFKDFEEELKNGKIFFEQKELQKKQISKQRKAAKKSKKEELLKSAKSKLTKEELKVLNLK